MGSATPRAGGAVVTYEVEWPDEAYLPNERFTFHLARGGSLRITRFLEDDHLPGLGDACNPESAQRLVSRHVLAMPPRRLRVQVVRYRPGSHAVLRHRMGRSRLYVRVVHPSASSLHSQVGTADRGIGIRGPQAGGTVARGGRALVLRDSGK